MNIVVEEGPDLVAMLYPVFKLQGKGMQLFICR
jgi:hypothetical protein